MAKKGSAETTVVEEAGGGTMILHRQVREWQPQAPETLRQIEATIDSWGRPGSTVHVPERKLDLAYVETQVDRLTRRVKDTRKEVVTETVTEWVEGPVGSGPINVEETREPAETAWSGEEASKDNKDKKPARPKRGFRALGFFGPKKDKPAKAKNARTDKATFQETREDVSDKEYQPQCSALTADGAQCRNSARGDSRYCISHFGYQPPTTKGLAQRIEGDAWDPDDHVTDHQSVRSKDTRPAVRKAPDTRLRTRKPARKAPARKAAARRPARKAVRKASKKKR